MKHIVPIQIYRKKKGPPLPVMKLRRVAERIFHTEKIPRNQQVNLICCSDYKIRSLNKKFRKIDKATDVLSFPFNESDFLGEIYISIPRTEVQARRFDVTFNEEFLRLFIHGLLHLAGYDHMADGERKVMEEKEQNVADAV